MNDPSAKPIRILSVEDHPVFGEGLRTIIATQKDMLLVARASSATDALSAYRTYQPDVTLVDLRLHMDGSGLAVVTALRAESQRARILVLATSESDREIQPALQQGALAYILKSAPESMLLALIRQVSRRGGSVPSSPIVGSGGRRGDRAITARELEVLRLIHSGYRNKEIADALAISETTVNFHIRNIVGKLEANDRTHAVILALKQGLLQI